MSCFYEAHCYSIIMLLLLLYSLTYHKYQWSIGSIAFGSIWTTIRTTIRPTRWLTWNSGENEKSYAFACIQTRAGERAISSLTHGLCCIMLPFRWHDSHTMKRECMQVLSTSSSSSFYSWNRVCMCVCVCVIIIILLRVSVAVCVVCVFRRKPFNVCLKVCHQSKMNARRRCRAKVRKSLFDSIVRVCGFACLQDHFTLFFLAGHKQKLFFPKNTTLKKTYNVAKDTPLLLLQR